MLMLETVQLPCLAAHVRLSRGCRVYGRSRSQGLLSGIGKGRGIEVGRVGKQTSSNTISARLRHWRTSWLVPEALASEEQRATAAEKNHTRQRRRQVLEQGSTHKVGELKRTGGSSNGEPRGRSRIPLRSRVRVFERLVPGAETTGVPYQPLSRLDPEDERRLAKLVGCWQAIPSAVGPIASLNA